MKLVGYIQHSDRLPAPVLLVFSDNSKFLYRPNPWLSDSTIVCDSNVGNIAGYYSFTSNHKYDEGVDDAVFGFKLSDSKIDCLSRDRYPAYINEKLDSNLSRLNPFLFVSLANLIGNTKAESSLADICARKLVGLSKNIASDWVGNAVLSDAARVHCQLSLDSISDVRVKASEDKQDEGTDRSGNTTDAGLKYISNSDDEESTNHVLEDRLKSLIDHGKELHTRCTNCKTLFRVEPELVAMKDSRARCGECLTVFDSWSNLMLPKLVQYQTEPSDVKSDDLDII